jgi:hypothetical protein
MEKSAGPLGATAGYIGGLGSRAAKGLKDFARQRVIKSRGSFRRGFEAGSGTSATARRSAQIGLNKSVEDYAKQQKKGSLMKKLKIGGLAAAGIGAAGLGTYLYARHKKKQEEAQTQQAPWA